MNQIVRAIKKLVMEPIVRLQDTTKRFSEPLTIDLSEARSQVEYQVYGDVMIVEDIDGIATVCLNHKENSILTLRIGRKIYQDFWRFFITNVAQAGKTLKIVVGREGCFDITETDYWINLLKDKQDEAKKVLDNIKSKTDNLDELLSLAGLRNFHDQYNGNDASLTIDLTTDYPPYSIRGQDFIVHNLGGSNITVSIDGNSAKTVKNYDVFTFSKSEWYTMEITNPSSVNFEITIVGDVL